MTEPSWAGYVGMATGIIGAITGVAGMILGYVSYKHSNTLKSLDLRLELRKAVNDAHSSLSQLKERIECANRSRQAVASATGRLGSGMMEQWKQEVQADKIKFTELSERASSTEETFELLNPKDLESKLVETHLLQVQIEELRGKYDAALRSNDEERKHIRASSGKFVR